MLECLRIVDTRRMQAIIDETVREVRKGQALQGKGR